MCAECPARLAADLEAAFPQFLAHHQDLVFGLALRMTLRQADAEDLAQDTFVRAFRALQGYAPERIVSLRTRGWLATIATNLGRNRVRRRRPPTVELGQVEEAASDDRHAPEALVQEHESARAWRVRLEALPRRYRDAVALRHVDGLSYAEVAIVTGRPLGTVKSDVHRGVRMLREAMLAERASETSREAGR